MVTPASFPECGSVRRVRPATAYCGTFKCVERVHGYLVQFDHETGATQFLIESVQKRVAALGRLFCVCVAMFCWLGIAVGSASEKSGEAREDVFDRAAKFTPDGPLPEFPPLPPPEKRPLLLLEPGGHAAFVRQVFFTPDNSRVVSVSEDKTVRVWDNFLGEQLFSVPLPAGPGIEGQALGAALSPDGKKLAVGVAPLGLGKLGIPIYLLDVETGELLDLVDCPGVAGSVEFSRNGQWLLVGTMSGAVGVYDLEKDRWIYMLPKAHKGVRMARFHPKQKTVIASVGDDRNVKIWDMKTTEPTAVIPFQKEGSNCIDWLPNGTALGVGCGNGEMHLVSPTGKLQKSVPLKIADTRTMQIVKMRFTPDGKKFVSGGVATTGWAGITDIATGRQIAQIDEHMNTVMAVDISADGKIAASAGGENNEMLVWKAATGEIIRRFEPSSTSVWAVAWSKDRKSIAWGNTNARPKGGLCQIQKTFSLTDFLPGDLPKDGAYTQDLHQHGEISIKVDDFFHFTVLENGKQLYQHKSLADRIYSVSLLPGKGIVVGASHRMYLIDLKSGNMLREFQGDNGLTTAVAPSPDSKHFVTGSTDQVIRIWSPDEEEPLLSLFIVGREWIAWTPRGYYACSAVGERLIAWQVNDGINKLPAVHSAAMFHPSLYQPKMLKYLIPAASLPRALAMATKFENEKITATELAAALPPSVSITAPTTVKDKPFVVRAAAEGSEKKPILSMRLLVDGRTFQGDAGVRKFENQAQAEASWDLSLEPGIHTLTVLAESPVSKGQSKVVRVRREGTAGKSNLYVLGIGVSKYPEPMRLQYAASDAEHFAKAVESKSKSIFTKVETKLLLDKEATLKNLREGLDWLKRKMSASDVGIVYFSGHGGRDEKDEKFYLIPVDIGADLAKTGLPGDEVRNRLENMPGKLIAILDACHSGSAADASQSGSNPSSRSDDLVRDLLADECGIIVLASSLGSEYSLESSATSAGFYTFGLIEAMAKPGDLNHDGFIYINELAAYAALRVQQLSRGAQNPTLGRSPQLRPFPLLKP